MGGRKMCYLVVGTSLFVHVCFLASLRSGLLNGLFFESSAYEQASDFLVVHRSGSRAISGDSIYRALGYRYLPISAYLLMGPLSLMEPEAAYRLWVAVLEALVFLNIALSYRLAKSRNEFLISLVMWISFFPFYLNLYMGQFSFLMATLLFLACYGFLCRREVLFAAGWISSVFLKVISILFVPYFLKIGKKRLVMLCISVLILTTLPYFGFFREDIPRFAVNFSPEAGLYLGNLGLQGLLAAVGAEIPLVSSKLAIDVDIFGHEVDVNFLFLSLSLVIFIVALRASLVSDERLFLENISMWILVYFLVYGRVWEHHYNFLLPIVILLYLSRVLSRKLLVTLYLLLAMPTPFVLLRHVDTYAVRVLYHSFKPVPVLILFFSLVRRILLLKVS